GPKASPTCGAPAVTGVGRDKAAKIYYRALSTYFVSTTNYASARTGSLSAAADLYGKCGTEYRAVNAAWAGAGVKAASDPCGTTPPTTPPPSTPPTTPPGGTYENTTDVAIADNKTVTSTITVSGRTGNAPATLKVSVDIKHTYIGDLVVDLIAPDGTAYNLHNRTGGSTANLLKTVTVNASSETANGAWKLRVADKASGDTGKIDAWSLQF
ncbi:MAG: hypothetical protein QOI35_2041, partial [Cryptosporangiaceae bacterium]|nr:hypothetical protein [Cryptosporangiaceae bacterium]